jgi:hypothetical protein
VPGVSTVLPFCQKLQVRIQKRDGQIRRRLSIGNPRRRADWSIERTARLSDVPVFRDRSPPTVVSGGKLCPTTFARETACTWGTFSVPCGMLSS